MKMIASRRVLVAFFAFVAFVALATSLTTGVGAQQNKEIQCAMRYEYCVHDTYDPVTCGKQYKECMGTSLQDHAFASDVALVFNCAWARAEMQRCATVYASTHSDDEYEACIRVPSATIENDPKCAFPAATVESEVESVITPVMGMRECVKECKSKGKDAANKCKHEKFAKRAQCYARVPTTVKACETGCTRKPRGQSLSSTPTRPLLGDCQPCDTNLDHCLPACNGMSDCQTKCMLDHFNCRIATPGC